MDMKQKLLGAASTIALIVSLGQVPSFAETSAPPLSRTLVSEFREIAKPPAPPATTAFNVASMTWQGVESEKPDFRECFEILAKSPTALAILERNNLSWYNIAYDSSLMLKSFLGGAMGTQRLGDIRISPAMTQATMVAVLIHEIAHAEQTRLLGFSTFGASPLRALFHVKMKEAAAYAIETRVAWELKDRIPNVWRMVAWNHPDFATAFSASMKKDPGAPDLAMARTFDAFFDSKFCAAYEETTVEFLEINKELRLLPLHNMEEIRNGLAKHGFERLEERLGRKLDSVRYTGCHESSLRRLRKAYPDSRACPLPPLRKDAPAPPLSNWEKMALAFACAPLGGIWLGAFWTRRTLYGEGWLESLKSATSDTMSVAADTAREASRLLKNLPRGHRLHSGP